MNLLLRICRLAGFFTIFGLLALAHEARAQGAVGYGDWQVYLPTTNAVMLADAGDRLYVAGADAFYYYDKSMKTTRLLTRRDGLNAVGVRSVAYDSVTQQTLVAYRNGNLDVLRADGTISNISDIVRKEISGNKDINHIYFSGRLAYLSCSFGLVVLDMTRLEVRESYSNIGPNGATLAVYATTILRDSLYAATSNGLMRGRLADNLLDYRRWLVDRPGTGDAGAYRTMATHNGHVYAGANGNSLHLFKGNTLGWQPVRALSSSDFRRLRSSRAGLLVVLGQEAGILNNAGTYTRLNNALLTNPQDLLRDKDGTLYVADAQKGLLVSHNNGQNFESFVTNAPATATSYSLLTDRATNTVNVFAGGYADRYLQNGTRIGASEYREGRWTTLEPRVAGTNQLVLDMSRGVRTPDGTLYIASYGNGLVQWKGPDSYQLFNPLSNQPNPLKSAITNPDYTRITDLATDTEGNLWMVNRHSELGPVSGLHRYNPAEKSWATVPYQPGFDNLDRIALDEFDGIWASLSRNSANGGGMMATDGLGNTRYFTSTSGGLPVNEVYDIVRDRKGAIWVALNGNINGSIAVYDNPSEAFIAGNTTGFRTPTLQRSSAINTDVNFATLRGERVLCIAVDGGNRKWFGTERGLWLFSEDADEALLHFTTENSPLPSNIIRDVAVDDRTGAVFVATDAGLVSYQGNATVSEGKPSCANVFPNPVRTNFSSEVSISGLVNSAVVKITDVTGKLVYQTRANGGTITWNLADYNGRKVNSGVYLVLSSDADGNHGCISKVAVVQQ